MLDHTTQVFINAKYLIERALDLAYIEEPFMFNKGYVRSIAMNFTQGANVLNSDVWNETIVMTAVMMNNTNITSLDDFPAGILPGPPILEHFMPPFEEGQMGVSEEEDYYSTFVEVNYF